MPAQKKVAVVNDDGGKPVWLPGHGVLAATGRVDHVPDSADLRFLLEHAPAVRQASEQEITDAAAGGAPKTTTPTTEA